MSFGPDAGFRNVASAVPIRSASAAGSPTGAGGRNVAGSTGAVVVVVVGAAVVVVVAAVVLVVVAASARSCPPPSSPPPQAATARLSASPARLVAMGLRERFLRLLHTGAPVDHDPDALVEAADVPLTQGPLLLSRLESEGIDATGIESFDIVTNIRSRMRIMVRHADLAAAREIIERG
jgi:hypothetical protein